MYPYNPSRPRQEDRGEFRDNLSYRVTPCLKTSKPTGEGGGERESCVECYFSHLSRAQIDFLMAITMSYRHLQAFKLSVLVVYLFIYGEGGGTESHVSQAGLKLGMEPGMPLNFLSFYLSTFQVLGF